MTRHEPQQARARVTQSKIIDAAAALYADPEVGRDRLETNTVAARAGVSIGTVYRYFEDRVDLMDVIAPDRDYPSAELLSKIERWVQKEGELPAGTPREIVTFLEAVS